MRLIDADELSKHKFHPVPYTHITPKDADAESYKWGWNDAVDAIMSEAPTIEPVKHGRWICEDGRFSTCSECGDRWGIWSGTLYYCPNCGAKMDGGGE